MEDLVSQEEIQKQTNISQSQFKSFRRYGLVDGYAKKVSIVRSNEKKTTEKGREVYTPAGFHYLYPRKVLQQISWVLEQRRKGKNLSEIQRDLIKKMVEEEESLKRKARRYEKVVTVPAGSSGDSGFRKRIIEDAVMEITHNIKDDNPDRDIKTLVFLIEQEEKQQGDPQFQIHLSIRLDVESSQF